MKISVITAVFNRENTIAGAIKSTQEQTYRDLEHIIIDGASTDGTLAEIERLSNSEMRVFSEPDDGIYDALNKGLACATGDIVGLMHSDDLYAHPGVLEKVVHSFQVKAVDAVYGDLDYVSASNDCRVIRHWKAGEYSPTKLRRGWMPPHPALFLRREVIERLGGYDTSYRIAADYDSILRYFGRGEISSTYVPEVFVKMRMGGESNRSLSRIILKSREDYRALKTNEVGGVGALLLKNLSKLQQFVSRA